MTCMLSFVCFHMNFEFTFFFKSHAAFVTFKFDDNIIDMFLFVDVSTMLIGELPIAHFAMMGSFSCKFVYLHMVNRYI